MDYLPVPNFLLEALAYLGRKAGGYTGQYTADYISRKGVADLSPFWARFAPIERLSSYLDSRAPVPQQALARLFNSLPGFPYSTTGTYSPAFLLFYPVLSRYDGDFPALMEHMRSLSLEDVARHLLLSLELGDGAEPAAAPVDKLMDSIRSLDIPPDSKLSLLDALHRYDAILEEAAGYLSPILAALEECREPAEAIIRLFSQELEAIGLEAYLQQTSRLSVSSGVTYHLRPFLFGLDTNLSVVPSPSPARKEILLYSGVLRRCLLEQLSTAEDEAAEVLEAIKLMGDRTRFDILCFLRDRSAYGQELSDHFCLARNTVHHHMSKLSNAGLITCTVDGNRVYYAVDKPSMDRLLARQRRLLLGDFQTPDCLA